MKSFVAARTDDNVFTNGIRIFLLIIFGILTIMPLYFMLVSSFIDPNASAILKFSLIPRQFTAGSYNYFLTFNKHVYRWLFNSLFVAATVTACNVFFASMAGYAFAKLRFPGRDFLFWLLLVTMMIPYQVVQVPLYILVINIFGLQDTYAALILPGIVTVYNIFLMKQFMSSLPTELIEAATIDGCSQPRTFFSIIFPLSKPGLAVMAILTFVGQWNLYFWPFLVTKTSEMRTIQVGLASFKFAEETQFGPMMAGAVIASIPMFVLFFSLQKYFLQGITIGAVKG